MQVIFIRHCEPDYSIDSLTQKGFREAACLARRIKTWDVTQFFCSPQGRARATAQPSLDALGATAETHEWLHEFTLDAPLPRPDGRKEDSWVLFDLLPDYWTKDPVHFDPDNWFRSAYCRGYMPDIAERVQTIWQKLDAILARYGYVRDGKTYKITEDAQRDATLVFVCHLGQIGISAGHILNISAMQLWHDFWLAPSSVTVLNTEERQGDRAGFRCQVFGDTAHLAAAGEPVSHMGGFAHTVFQH